jgi:organic hydroperoxide reductase OsmC/OhrA
MEHHASVVWRRTSEDFTYATYNRAHEMQFGDVTVPASAAPDFKGDADRANPEEAFVAALSSCHMLTFLAIVARKRLSIDAYIDHAVGYLEKNDAGRLAMTRVILRPKVAWSSDTKVSASELDMLHHEAHEGCFIAQSVKTEVKVEAQDA